MHDRMTEEALDTRRGHGAEESRLGVMSYLEAVSDYLDLNPGLDVTAWITGSAAFSYWTNRSFSGPLEVSWSHRLAIPPMLQVYEIPSAQAGELPSLLALSPSTADAMAPVAEGWRARAHLAGKAGMISVRFMDPADLVVSSLGAMNARLRADIALLARLGLLQREALKQRGDEAIGMFVGDTVDLRNSLFSALSFCIPEPRPE